jgi:hypothetical protein
MPTVPPTCKEIFHQNPTNTESVSQRQIAAAENRKTSGHEAPHDTATAVADKAQTHGMYRRRSASLDTSQSVHRPHRWPITNNAAGAATNNAHSPKIDIHQAGRLATKPPK